MYLVDVGWRIRFRETKYVWWIVYVKLLRMIKLVGKRKEDSELDVKVFSEWEVIIKWIVDNRNKEG